MAQNVGVPRFFVNMPEFFAETGQAYSDSLPELYRTLPVNVQYRDYPDENDLWLEDVPFSAFTDNCFLAVLGHRNSDSPHWGSETAWVFKISDGPYGNYNLNFTNDIQINASIPDFHGVMPIYNGFTIASFDKGTVSPTFWTNFISGADGGSRDLGSVIIGNYYEMSHAPNLSLTLERQYGGTKEITTYNGSSMSNTMWSKPPKWGVAGAWELFHTAGNPPIIYDDWLPLSRSGRKTWKLSFSYLDDGDLWGPNQMIFSSPHQLPDTYQVDLIDTSLYIGEDNDDIIDKTEFKYDLLSDDNFFSQVWHKTLGGTIPFLFQPDKNNSDPDQFAICRFADNSLKATQISSGLYDISVTIEEAW